MSAANVEIVRRVYDAVARRDTATVLNLYDPDIEWDAARTPVGGLMGPNVYRGHEGLRRWFREWYEAWENVEEECQELIASGEQVVSVITVRARGRTSGVTLEQRRAGVWTIHRGRIVRVVWFPTREEALEAAGLAEPRGPRSAIELAGQVIEALNRRDLSRMLALADPEVEWHSFFAEVGEGGVYRGHEGARQWLSDLDDAWEIVRADVDHMIGVGDVAVLVGRIHYRGRGSGVETESPAGWMLRFRQGRVTCFRAFREPEQALASVGLRS